MTYKKINASNGPKAEGGYSQAVEVTQPSRRLYISGQIPETADGEMPASFEDQANLVWQNVIAQLHAADMTIENIVKVTTFLSDREYRDENGEIRRKYLQDQEPALTVIITGIYDEEWLLEIEAIAEA